MPIRAPRSAYLFRIFGSGLVIGTAQLASGQVVVNEFLYHDRDSNLEFVELINIGSSAVDARMFRISDERRSPVDLAAQPLVIHPGAVAVFVRNAEAFDARYSVDRTEVRSWPALNNQGDEVLLWADGRVVDSVAYDGSWSAPGQSVERIDPRGPGDSPANWGPSSHPSGATPGAKNSLYSRDETPPWIVDVEEWIDGTVIVYASEPLMVEQVRASEFRFSSGRSPISAVVLHDRMRVVLEPGPFEDLESLGVDGLVDASGNASGRLSMIIARQPEPNELVLNEILFEPDADPFDGTPDQREYVEIRSVRNRPIALRGLYLTGPVFETGLADTLRSDGKPRRIHANGYAFFHAAATDGVPFRDAFPSTPPDSVSPAMPVERSSLLLDNSGDTVRLHSADDDLIDELSYSSGWHLPELPDTRGVALERISPHGSSNDRANWTSSTSNERGTPGRDNSVSPRTTAPGGSAVVVAPSPFSPDGDGLDDFTHIDVRLGVPIATVALWIFDAAGRLVRRITDAQAVGPQATFVWDGRDETDTPVSTGIYVVYVEAVDTSAGRVARFKRTVVLARAF